MKAVLEGATLSGGYSRVSIAPSDTFQFYIHEDSRPPVAVPLSIQNITVDNHLVIYGNKPRVSVIEHLFSVLCGLNLYNVRIDVFGDELPFFDGSSRAYTDALVDVQQSGVTPLLCKQAVSVCNNGSFITFEPLRNPVFSVNMELVHPYISRQKLSLEITRETYIREIAHARTFVFTKENDPRLRVLPPYGIGITPENVYSHEPLRFQDELVRHKILDLLGDLFVLRKKFHGRIVCRNTSHALNLAFVKKIQSEIQHGV